MQNLTTPRSFFSRSSIFAASVIAVMGMTQVASAQFYVKITDRAAGLAGGAASPNLVTGVVSSDSPNTVYNVVSGAVSGTASHRITSSTGLSPFSTDSINTQLVATSTWNAASGGANSIVGLLYDIGTQLQIVDTSGTGTRAIYRINKLGGAVTNYVSNSTLNTAIGTTSGSIITSTFNPTNSNPVFYSNFNQNILQATGANTVSQIVDVNDAPFGTNLNFAGLTMSPTGTIYFGNNNTNVDANARGLWSYNGTSFNLLLDLPEGSGSDDNFSNGALFYAPDNLIYYRNTLGDIRTFNPSSSAVATVLTSAQLLAGPAGGSLVTNFTWFDGRIAWINGATASSGINQGLYALPEPATLSLLLAGGTVLLGRRRSR